MEIKVTFIYETRTILVLCSEQDEMTSLFQKFIHKLNPSSTLNNYIFYYEGNILNNSSTIKNNPLLSGKKEFTISAQKNLRIIKCPKCNYNDCIVNLYNYKLEFYGCEHNHSILTTYDKYLKNQKMELSDIKCCSLGCQNNEENNNKDFYLCLTCSKLLNNTKSYCYDCKEKHDKEHNMKRFDEKNYYCRKHFNQFIKYCFKCKKNLCDVCVKEHAEHQIQSYESMCPSKKDLNDLTESLDNMKKNIETLRIVIEDIIYSLNGTMRIYQNYYDIAKRIIEKYELFNKELKNYTILKSLRNLKFSNIQIMKDLSSIIEEKDMKKLQSSYPYIANPQFKKS